MSYAAHATQNTITVNNYGSNLVELLRHRALTKPMALAYTFLKDGQEEGLSYTYRELDTQARAIAVALGAAQGERALLLYPPGIEFIAGFFGALYAGVIAIPAPPPDATRLKRTLPRLHAIISDAAATLVLTTAELVKTLAPDINASAAMRWLATDQMDLTSADAWPGPPPIDNTTLAYLQYTSGSTATPKGVMLTHRNIMAQSATLQSSFAYDQDAVAVTWMPYFHDYGLIDGLLQPLYNGVPCYVLSPLTFLRRPERWLEAIARYRGTHTQAPNFAYEQCLQKISAAKRATLDLSSLREASNGAEPIRRETVEGFITTFAACGLRPEAVYPAYGLAETTLLVTTKPHHTSPRYCHVAATALEQNRIVVVDPQHATENYRTIVSCGVPVPGVEMVIVDLATTHLLPDDAVGEIWVASASVGAGYWQRPVESEATFRARLADQPQRGPFLRTGDLGFMHAGELYLTGRHKDLIIIAGVNHYPQDIEWTVQSLDSAFRRDHCVAFAIESQGEERLVVVAEMEQEHADWSPLLNMVRRALAENHDLDLYGLQLLKKGEVLKTSSGKLQRRACREAYLKQRFHLLFNWQRQIDTNKIKQHPEHFEQWLCNQLARQLGVAPTAIQRTTPFAEYGLTSRAAVSLVGELEQWWGTTELPATLLWEYPTIAALHDYLLRGVTAANPLAVNSTPSIQEPLAIIGMSCRVPGATNLAEFWDLLASGRDAITEVPSERWSLAQFYAPAAGTPGHINNRDGGFITAVDGFDAALFGITPAEATVIDPQQRLLLELTWEALEASGIDPQQLAGSATGVFIGISTDDYSARQFTADDRIGPYTAPGKALAIAANRISYQFDLRGPSMAIDTACSSSLVALHQAALALRQGDCTLALVGGVNLVLTPQLSIALAQAGMLSPTGRCHAFDAAADGYVRSEGGGMVVLKPLSAAQRAGDTIWALLRGSAVNQDGRSNGLTAPNGLAQQAVIQRALHDAGVAAAAISVVEAHGTGTALGDPIEVRALQAVLGNGRDSATQPCLIGSVKSNIGHLEAAAGIAGLIKLVLSIRHDQVPPTVHFKTLNPLITLHRTAFAIADHLQPWPAGEKLASISAFGFGGTNAHAILAAPPSVAPAVVQEEYAERDRHLLLISAHTPRALQTLAARYLAQLRSLPAADCGAFCYSAAIGRTTLQQRLALVGNHATLESQLADFGAQRAGAPGAVSANASAPKIVWLFTGQGSQYSGMGEQLYRHEPFFRAELDRCNQVLEPLIGIRLSTLLYDPHYATWLDNTYYTQPALFALEVALARTLLHWGLRPDAVIGYSVGEYAAACIAGVFDLPTGLRLIAARGQAVAEYGAAGGMAAVRADETTVRAAIATIVGVELVILNGPAGQVIAGNHTDLALASAQLTAAGIEVKPLKVSHPFHAAGMVPVQAALTTFAQQLVYQPPSIPLVSNLTGDFIEHQIAQADYWIDHLRQPVYFAASIERVLAAGCDTFLEIGPRPTLLGMARRCDPAGDSHLWLPTLRAGEPDGQRLLHTLGQLWQRGVVINWPAVYDAAHYPRLELPHYPFERQRFWLDDAPQAQMAFGLEIISSPLLSGTLLQAQFSRQRLPFYDEHQVFDTVVIPAAGHLVLLLEAVQALHHEPACLLENMLFPQPLILPAVGARQVQLLIEKVRSDGTQPLQLISRVAASDSFATHAHGILRHVPSAPLLATTTLAAAQQHCGTQYSDNFYTAIWQPQIALGPAFRGIVAFARHDDVALAQLRLPTESGPYHTFHPGLLDAALQVLAALVTLDVHEAMIPFSIAQLAYYGYAPARLSGFWSQVTLRTSDDPTLAVADVRLWAEFADGSNQLVAELRDFRARRVRREGLLRELQHGYQQHLYQLDWQPYSRVATMVPSAGTWLLFNDRAGRAAALATQQGLTVSELMTSEQIAAYPTVLGVIFGTGLNLQGTPDLTTIEPVVTLLLAVVRQLAITPLPLVILTAGGQTLREHPGAPLAAALWALGRVVRREFSTWPVRLLDLERTPERDAELPLLLHRDQPSELAWRDGHLYQPLLQPYHVGDHDSLDKPIRTDRCYMITGGLGVLGLLCAQWLADQGAGEIILLGRRAPQIAQTTRLAALGVQTTIRVIQCDVADETRLTELWPTLINGARPLAGIFHLAGVLDDALLTQQSWTRFASVLAPKINGSWQLHQLSQALTLDHFVVFSSIAPVVGSAGQGNYAFANGYMDALMAQRRAAGLPGLALNWGPWHGGMAADLTQRLSEWGLEMLDPTRALTTLTALLATPVPAQLAIFPVDWRRFINYSGANPLYDHLQPTVSVTTASHWTDSLATAEPTQRWQLLEQRLRETIAATIGLTESNALGARQRLFEIGLDSLGAMELRNRLVALLGRDLRATLLFDYPTLEALLNHIANDVLAWPRHDATALAATTAAQDDEVALATLSDAELAALLAAELMAD